MQYIPKLKHKEQFVNESIKGDSKLCMLYNYKMEERICYNYPFKNSIFKFLHIYLVVANLYCMYNSRLNDCVVLLINLKNDEQKKSK